MAQRLASPLALYQPFARCRARPLACRAGRRITVIRARQAAAESLGSRRGELVEDLLSIAGAARNGSPLAEESQERLKGVLEGLLKTCAPRPAQNPLLSGEYQLVWGSRPTAGPTAVKRQVVTIGQDGDYTNTATFTVGGILPGIAKRFGAYKATGAKTFEVVFDRLVVDKGILGKNEMEDVKDQGGYLKFEILYLGEDALVTKVVAPENDPPTQLVFQRLSQKPGQKSELGATKTGKAEKPTSNDAEQSKSAADIIADKRAAKQKALAASKQRTMAHAKKFGPGRSVQTALIVSKEEYRRKAAEAAAAAHEKNVARKLKQEREAAKEAASKAQRLRKDMAEKEKILQVLSAQRSAVAKAQAVSREAIAARRAAERDTLSTDREAAAADQKVAAAEAAAAKAMEEAERTLSAKRDVDASIRQAQQELRELQRRARSLRA